VAAATLESKQRKSLLMTIARTPQYQQATSPIFTVILSYVYLREPTTLPVLMTLVPIIVGVTLSTTTELHFSIIGFFSAILSTFIFSCQNVYSKKLFREDRIDWMMLLLYTSGVSFCLMLPFVLLAEVPSLQLNSSLSHLIVLYATNGFCHFMQNILAFFVLSLISPLTYAIANTFKRVFVIVASIIYFQNRVALLNLLGVCIAIVYVLFCLFSCSLSLALSLFLSLSISSYF
jgi:solute carrier family 35 protein E1